MSEPRKKRTNRRKGASEQPEKLNNGLPEAERQERLCEMAESCLPDDGVDLVECPSVEPISLNYIPNASGFKDIFDVLLTINISGLTVEQWITRERQELKHDNIYDQVYAISASLHVFRRLKQEPNDFKKHKKNLEVAIRGLEEAISGLSGLTGEQREILFEQWPYFMITDNPQRFKSITRFYRPRYKKLKGPLKDAIDDAFEDKETAMILCKILGNDTIPVMQALVKSVNDAVKKQLYRQRDHYQDYLVMLIDLIKWIQPAAPEKANKEYFYALASEIVQKTTGVKIKQSSVKDYVQNKPELAQALNDAVRCGP